MENANEILIEIESAEKISFDTSFRIVSYCTQLLAQHTPQAELIARRLVIHVLNNWNKVDSNVHELWADIIETLGFYPYIRKNVSDLKLESFADEVRMSYFQSDYLQDTYLHKEQ